MPVSRLAPIRDERGFTLIEMLMVTLLASIVFSGALYVVENSMRASKRVADRTETVQRGRTALEQISQRLRSQVCLGTGIPAVISGDGTSITFYSDLNDEEFKPEKRRISFAGGKITEDVWIGTGTPPSMTWPANPTRTRVLTTHISQVGTTPYLQYYAFTASDPIEPTDRLAVPLSAADAARAVSIAVSFEAHPTNAPASDPVSTTFQDNVYVRTADPMDPLHSPQCI